MSYKYYMNDTTQQYYYGKIRDKNSVENDADNFWLNLLPDYFQKQLKYGIEQEARPLPEVTKQRADWTIRYIKNGDPKKVILMEDKRKGLESQAAEWATALDQLTRYVKLVRTERNQDPTQTLYGAVNIGTYTRFYQLDPYKQECIDSPDTNGKYYELAANEAEIHAILLDLVQKTSHGENTSARENTSATSSGSSSLPIQHSITSSYASGSTTAYSRDNIGSYYLHSNGAKIYWIDGKHWYLDSARQWVEYTGT